MEQKFSIQDPRGVTISCSEERWEGHIVSGHPIMKNNLNAVVEALSDPDKIFSSIESVDSEIYFKKSETPTYGERFYTKVVTTYTGGSTSEVVSAWNQKEIKGGINLEIYQKSK